MCSFIYLCLYSHTAVLNINSHLQIYISQLWLYIVKFKFKGVLSTYIAIEITVPFLDQYKQYIHVIQWLALIHVIYTISILPHFLLCKPPFNQMFLKLSLRLINSQWTLCLINHHFNLQYSSDVTLHSLLSNLLSLTSNLLALV